MQVSAIGSAVQISTNRPQGMTSTGQARPELLSRFELARQILGITSSSAASAGDREVATSRTGSFRAAPVDASGRTAAKAAGKTVAALLDGLDAAASRALPLKPGQVVRDLVQRAVSGEIADAAGQTGRTVSGDVQRAVRSYAAELAAAAPAAKTATDAVRTDSVAADAASTTTGTLPRTVSEALPAPRIPALAPTANADVTPRPQGPGEVATAGPGLAERGRAEQAKKKHSKKEHSKAGHGAAGRDKAEHPHAHPGHAGSAHPAGPHGHGVPKAGSGRPHRAGDQNAPGTGKPEGKVAHDVRDARLPAAPGGAPAAKPPAVPAPAEKPATETSTTEKAAAPRPAPDTKSDPRAAAARTPKAEAPKDASAVRPVAEAKAVVEAKPVFEAKPALRTEAAPPKAEAKAAQPAPAPQVAKGASAAVSAAVKSYKAQ